MTTPARFSRLMHFRSGPQAYTFYACERHKEELEAGRFNDHFFATGDEPVATITEEEGIYCDRCREP